jgi:hypothetical protein
MRQIKILFLLLVLQAPIHADAHSPYRVLYPYGLLSDDFGIMSETDLAVDTWRGTPHPYEEKGFNGGYPYWSCFPTRRTSTSYESWRAADPMGRADKVVTMCALDFVAETESEIHRFVGRRAYRVEQCRYFTAEWKRITRGQSYVCFNAYGGEAEPRKTWVEVKAEKIWTWDRIKTKRGCMSYFEGECDAEYWEKWRREELSKK